MLNGQKWAVKEFHVLPNDKSSSSSSWETLIIDAAGLRVKGQPFKVFSSTSRKNLPLPAPSLTLASITPSNQVVAANIIVADVVVAWVLS